MNRKKRTYGKETEAAWYAIREFIDLNNCSTEFDGSPIQMNFNQVLCHLYSKTRIFSPFTYSKRLYNEHLMQFANHYYRSKFHARHSIGYQRTDKQAQNAIFANDLGVLSKKSTYSSEIHPFYIMLLGFDIDGHNGEPDAQGVAEWLQTTYFVNSYWEPSTHFRGRHGYLKLAFPDSIPLDTVKKTLSELFTLLDQKRISMGFHAQIDDPCGLPASFYWDHNISILSPMPKISNKEYSRYRNVRNQLEKGQLSESNPYISLYRTYEQIDQIINIPLPCIMKQSQCLKLPRFNHTDPTKASMDDIRYFYNLKFYPYSYITELLISLKKEFHSVSFQNKSHSIGSSIDNTGKNEPQELLEKDCSSSLTRGSERLTDFYFTQATADFPPCQEGNTALLAPDPGETEPNIPRGEERGGPVIVRSPQGEPRIPIDPGSGSSENMAVYYGKNSKRNKCFENERTIHLYENRIEQIKSIPNKAALTSAFYLHYSNYLGRIPDIPEAHDEYIRLGLNQTHGKDNPKRIQRLIETRQFVVSLWDDSKRGFTLTDWNQVKTEMIPQVGKRVEGLDRSWSKGKNKSYQIKIEELALVYFAISKSNSMDAHKTNPEKGSFSYKQVKECFTLVYGKGCHRAKIARIFKVLKEAGLIVLVGNSEIGIHGNQYEAVPGESLFQTVNSSPESSRFNPKLGSEEICVVLLRRDSG